MLRCVRACFACLMCLHAARAAAGMQGRACQEADSSQLHRLPRDPRVLKTLLGMRPSASPRLAFTSTHEPSAPCWPKCWLQSPVRRGGCCSCLLPPWYHVPPRRLDTSHPSWPPRRPALQQAHQQRNPHQPCWLACRRHGSCCAAAAAPLLPPCCCPPAAAGSPAGGTATAAPAPAESDTPA